MSGNETLGLPGKAKDALAGLEALVKFDQSSSSKWPRITIVLNAKSKDSLQNDSVDVWPNGRPWRMERGVPCPVAPEVCDILNNAVEGVLYEDKNTPIGHSVRDTKRMPYGINDEQSQRRYAAWTDALAVLRHVVTEVEERERPDGKVVYTTKSRYLPEEQESIAEKIIAWVKKEIAADDAGKEKQSKAAEG